MADLPSVGFYGNDGDVGLEWLRKRLRKMTDAELQRDICAGEYMVSPHANFGKPTRQPFVIQFQEASSELERQASGCIGEVLTFLNS
jgi:hypothetical protein